MFAFNTKRSRAWWLLLLAGCGDSSGGQPDAEIHVQIPRDSGTVDAAAEDAGADGADASADSVDAGVDEEDAGSDASVSCTGAKDGTECADNRICVKNRCRPIKCGDGVLSAGEECDDGNTVDKDGCTATCTTAAACGNGKKEAGEECDDGNTKDLDGCSSACTTKCEACLASHLKSWKNGTGGPLPFEGVRADLLAACSAAPGNATSGPRKNDPRKDICLDLIACAHNSGCLYDSQESDLAAACYCGKGVDVNGCFFDPLVPKGPCKAEVEAAAETTDGQLVGAKASSLAPGEATLGFATAIALSEQRYCFDACAPEPGCTGLGRGAICGKGAGTCTADGKCDQAKAACGDIATDGTEACDTQDGTSDVAPYCSADCQTFTPPVCGNGVKEFGEECDDGDAIDTGNGCSTACKQNGICGNKKVEPLSGEECDDGNTVVGDGCALCHRE